MKTPQKAQTRGRIKEIRQGLGKKGRKNMTLAQSRRRVVKLKALALSAGGMSDPEVYTRHTGSYELNDEMDYVSNYDPRRSRFRFDTNVEDGFAALIATKSDQKKNVKHAERMRRDEENWEKTMKMALKIGSGAKSSCECPKTTPQTVTAVTMEGNTRSLHIYRQF